MTVVRAALFPLRIALGSGEAGVFSTGVPVLAGDTVEQLFGEAQPVARSGRLALFEADEWLIGVAAVPVSVDVEAATVELYRDLLRATDGVHLARIWNYVPAINAAGPCGMENYRLFCRGRATAFEQHHGAKFAAFLPSASAVGCEGSQLTAAFVATKSVPRHIENPMQVPAYNYPADYGPRAPSFARATVVAGSRGDTVFISGTAAIRGHVTVAPHQTREQLDCTLENLRAIGSACGLGPTLGRGGKHPRHVKVYVRHAAEQPAIAALLEEQLLDPADTVSYLRADICRAALNVEIELTLWPAARP